MEKQQKQKIINELKENLKTAKSFVLTDFKGISVPKDTEFRKNIRNNNVNYKVIKNTFINKALEELKIEGFEEYLVQNTAIAFSDEDEIAPSKVIVQESKNNEKIKIKAGYLNGNLINVDDIKRLAELPGLDELRAQFLRTAIAPISGFVNTSAGIIKKLMFACNAIIEKKNEE